MHNNLLYSTLTDVDVSSYSIQCQGSSNFIALPPGWSIAEDNADSRQVISMYPWSTHVLVLRSGASYQTRSYYPYGAWYSNDTLSRSSFGYAPTFCNGQILIVFGEDHRGRTHVIEYEDQSYSTLSDVDPLGQNLTCQGVDNFLALPTGWVIAVDNARSHHVIQLYPWSTGSVVLANGHSYMAGLEELLVASENGLMYDASQRAFAPLTCDSEILITYTGVLSISCILSNECVHIDNEIICCLQDK